MPDMLVKLYDLQTGWSHLAKQAALGISVRKPIGTERGLVAEWVATNFGPAWASEAQAALSNHPISCFVAIQNQTVVGFACYDATALGFFGPGGVTETSRGRGTGAALLLSCLLDMKLKGYAYAIIGDVGPTEFYKKTAGAVEIPDSTPGVYRDTLRP
jgi:hypothetical protein